MRRILTAILAAAMLAGILPLEVLASVDQAITFTSTPPSAAVVGGPAYAVSATSDSGLTVDLSIDGASNGACTLLGSTVRLEHVGTCVVDANQAGDLSFNPAPQVQQTFSIGQGSQTVAFTSTAPASALVGDTYSAAASATSGLPAALTIDPSAAAICSISGSTVQFDHIGTCVVDADQAGDADWAAAAQEQQSIPVGQVPQSITFTSTTPGSASVGGSPYDVAATGGGSGNPVVFTIDASAAGVCSISGSTVSFGHIGTCVIDADQGGSTQYAAATQVQQSFGVGKGDQAISFTSSAPVAPLVGDVYIPVATATSELPVALSVDPSSSAICSIAAGTVTFNAAGGCLIDADQAGNVDWNAAQRVQQHVGVQDTAPVCPDASAAVVMNVAQTGPAGCTDLEHDPLTYAIVTDGAHGTATIDAAGRWTYTPVVDYTGADSFTFKANDGSLDSVAATVSVTVTNSPVSGALQIHHVPAVVATTIDVLSGVSPGVGDTGQPLSIVSVTQGVSGRVSTNGRTITYDPVGCFKGTDAFNVTATDGPTRATFTVAVVIDLPGQNGVPVTPVTDTPAVGFVSGSIIGTTVPLRVSWCGVVAGALRGYNVVQSTNGGSSWTSTLYSTTFPTTRTSIITSLGVGTRYAWGVRTIDGSRRISTGYAASPASRIGRIQDSSTSIVRYSGSWGSARSSSYSGGTERWATRQSATATVVVSNVRAFAIVSSMAGTRGSFRVYVDGAQVAVVSERSSSTLYRRVVYVRSLTPGVRHTIAIRPYGNGLITLDAILTLE